VYYIYKQGYINNKNFHLNWVWVYMDCSFWKIKVGFKHHVSYTSVWGKNMYVLFIYLITNEKMLQYLNVTFWKYWNKIWKAKLNGIMHKSHVKM
jgi:hypothetical protein